MAETASSQEEVREKRGLEGSQSRGSSVYCSFLGGFSIAPGLPVNIHDFILLLVDCQPGISKRNCALQMLPLEQKSQHNRASYWRIQLLRHNLDRL